MAKRLIALLGTPAVGGGGGAVNSVFGRQGDVLAESGDYAHSQITLDDGSNPHGTTKSDVGLSNVDNTSDADKPVSTDTQAALDGKASTTDLSNHIGDTNNPHSVTAAQVGLGNVDNTSDADKPISTATQADLDTKLDIATTATESVKGALYFKDDSASSTLTISTSPIT